MKKMQKLVLVSVLLLCSGFNSCSNSKNLSNTISQAELTTSVKEKGVFKTDPHTKRPAIYVHTPHTIDEISVYLISDVKMQLPAENTEVLFTGKKRPSDQTAQLGGQTYYELELENIKVL